MMSNQWNIFEKMTRIVFYFGAQNYPDIGLLRPTFNIPLKVAQIDMYTKNDAKPLENFWENDQRLEFLLILGP